MSHSLKNAFFLLLFWQKQPFFVSRRQNSNRFCFFFSYSSSCFCLLLFISLSSLCYFLFFCAVVSRICRFSAVFLVIKKIRVCTSLQQMNAICEDIPVICCGIMCSSFFFIVCYTYPHFYRFILFFAMFFFLIWMAKYSALCVCSGISYRMATI